MSLRVLSREEIFANAPKWREQGGADYRAMYSSVFGGVVTEPAMMVLPVDDRVINRGDAIFEYFPFTDGHVYCLDAHMARLRKSAEIISLELPFDPETIAQLTLETIAISGCRDGGVRMFVTRGIGSFGCDPTSAKASQLYFVVLSSKFSDSFSPSLLTEGATAITAHVPPKMGYYAQVKTTDYVLNAMVDLEARRHNADFGVWFDTDGYLTESSTENVAIVSQDGVFKYPTFAHMLKGTGLLRGIELAQDLIASGELKGIVQTNIPQAELYEAAEILVLTSGTTLPVVKFDGRTIGSGKPGPVFRHLNELFQKDQKEGPRHVRTPVSY